MTENTALTTTAGAMAMLARADLAESTRTKYARALARYQEHGSLADADALIAYAGSLSNSARAIFKAALSCWQRGFVNALNAQATPGNTADIDAIERRFEATQKAIHVKRRRGKRAHTWLSKAQVKRLLAKLDTKDMLGLRDSVVIGLAVGCGLRRAEIAGARWQDIVTQPVDDKPTQVLQVTGKGDKGRVLPIPSWLKPLLAAWQACNGKTGYIARSVSRHGALGDSLSDVSVFRIIAAAGELIGIGDLAAHDLRRTFAQNVYEKTGHDLVVVQTLLGHSGIETTRRYLTLNTVSMADAVEWL